MRLDFCLVLGLFTSIFLFVSCDTSETGKMSPEMEEKTVEPARAGFASGLVGQLDSLDILCAASKAYNAEEWDERNHCRWALEKKILSQYPEYAKRKDNVLSLQMDDGQWMTLEHNTGDPDNAQYFQLRKYLPGPHHFILTQLRSQECQMHWFVDAKKGDRLFFTGHIWKHPAKDVFITGPGPLANCPAENHLIHFNKSGDIKSQKIKTSGKLTDIRWSPKAAYLKLALSDGTIEYRSWVLP